MSFYSEASLAYVASAGAGKDGKAYSMKPVDGTGDFTFSRGSNLAATRVGPTGLIEKGRENLLSQSNNFSQWSTNVSALTSGQTGYDGLSDAWLLTKSGANGFVYRSVSGSGIQTVSVYAKQGTNSWMQIYVVGTSNVRTYFDLGNGTLGAYAFNVIDRSIEDVGNGWYRCSVVFNNSTSQVRFFVSDGNNDDTGTSGSIYIQDAQLELGLATTDYIESGASTGKAGLLEDEPRFDYSGGATCPSLLLEPSRTNLYPYSEYSGVWSKTNWTTTDNYAISPEGVQNAFRAVSSSTGGILRFGGTGTTGQDNTLSVWAKSNTGSDQKFRFFANGNTIESSDFTATNEWQRFEYTYDCIFVTAGIKGASSELSDILFYGFQHEAGSYPTSYIPNHSGGTITRGEDNAFKNGLATLISDTEGTLFFDYVAKPDSNRYVSLSNGTLTYSILFGQNSSNYINARIFDNYPNTQVNIGSTPAVAGTRYKCAFSFGPSQSILSINGVSQTTNGFSGFADGSLTQIGYNNANVNSQPLLGNHHQLLYFNTQLTEAEMNTLTTL